MTNHFPSRLTAGLPLNLLMTLTAYPASAGWAVSVVIRGPSSIDLAATAEADQHRFTATADATKAWTAGLHRFSLRAALDDQLVEIEGGELTIDQDLAALPAGSDLRTHAEIVLDNIHAVIEKRATQDQARYVIGNRELWRTPLPDLLALKKHYQDLVNREKAKRAGKSGWGRQIKVKF